MKKAIYHLEVARGIASSLDAEELFWIHYSLSRVFRDQGKFEDTQTHLEHTKSHGAKYSNGRLNEPPIIFS